ncbi:3'-5' exonuclease [Rubinisphaera italica]|uniref:DNA 3'-5' helicase II n=1 Tax=Rubinisphaera italica TaxID=2527969 RepID=A0A5C5XH88_9PLAN|nr:3'-5' exonuclease [Rubinisphaera italica]TWT61663.1 DNA-dependent helicase II [Rubinisphaera italica]
MSGLILHLEQLASEELDIRYPPQGHDAVTLMTYHSAKGLEWPVVVLSGLNSDRSADMWSPVVTGGGQSDAGPLDGRILRSWTWPFGKTDGPFGGLRKGSGLEDDALVSREGQERTVRETDENLRLLYVGCTRAKHKLVFAHRAGKSAWLDRLPEVNSLLDSNLEEGEHGLDGIDTTLVLRRLNADMIDDCRIPALQQERWLSLIGDLQPSDLSPRFHSPSQASTESETATFQTEELAGSSHFPSGADESQYAAIGDAVHSYLAALPSIRSLDDAAKERVAERCLAAFSVTGVLSPSVLVSSGERFRQWVDAQYPNALWHVEMTASGSRAAGGDWSGAIDLVLQLPTGEVVVIDHKSAPIRREHCEAKAGQFAGQLTAYSELLTSAGETVQSKWIHFPLSGVVAKYN